MAGTINTSSIAKALWPGVKNWYGMEYSKHPLECDSLFDTEMSEKKYEEDVQVVGFGLAPVKTEAGGVAYDTMQQGYISRYVNIAYAMGFIVTHEEIEDNLYKKLAKQRSEALAFSMNQTKEFGGANVYNNAFTGGPVGGDGVSLLNSAHPIYGGTLSNILGTPAELSEAALETFAIQIGQLTDDRGLKINVRPEKLHIPVNLEFDAHRILHSVLQNDSANNAVNAIRALGLFPEGALVNHYFTAPHTYFIGTDIKNGLKHMVREKIDFSDDNDFETMNLKYKAYERYSFGWTDFRDLFGTNPT